MLLLSLDELLGDERLLGLGVGGELLRQWDVRHVGFIRFLPLAQDEDLALATGLVVSLLLFLVLSLGIRKGDLGSSQLLERWLLVTLLLLNLVGSLVGVLGPAGNWHNFLGHLWLRCLGLNLGHLLQAG